MNGMAEMNLYIQIEMALFNRIPVATACCSFTTNSMIIWSMILKNIISNIVDI